MTISQHMVALAAGNEIRLARSVVKRDLRTGRVTLAAVLEHPAVQSATIFDVLCWQHRVGRTRALTILDDLFISEGRRVDGLTVRQRVLVAEACQSGVCAA